MGRGKGISSFSVLLLMAVAAVVGAACFSMLNIQYTPSSSERTVSVDFSYQGASARIVEAEVTSKLEGALSNVSGCRSVSSESRNDGGSVTLEFGKKTDLQAVRFEMASCIRNIYSSLPAGCSYPAISLSSSGRKAVTAITYNILSSLPSKEIAAFVEESLIYPLSTVNGVENVTFNGYTPYEWVIEFDYDKTLGLGITADDISRAFSDSYDELMLGMVSDGDMRYALKLRSNDVGDMGLVPVKNVDGRVVRLGEIATMRYQEALPTSYYRINGLNTLNLAIGVSQDENLISVVSDIKAMIRGLRPSFPGEIDIAVSYDSSEYISTELHKIYVRTLLCLLILLVFAFAANRSWRYMLVVALTLAANMLIAVFIYWLVGLEIHIYTLAGVTVSLGIIIDNTIVMVDHYSRYRERSVFPALLSAVLTTVAALLVIFLLPDKERASLTEFSLAIIINLGVSLLVAYLFVPALLDYLPVRFSPEPASRARRLRRMVRWNGRYASFINWSVRRRWVLVLLFVMAFGIPTCLIPKEVEWAPYASHRKTIDKVLSSSFGLFYKAMDRSDFYREPQRPKLSVNAGMPEGCTVQQLNEVIRSMENYLAGISEIESFETEIYNARNGYINVLFKPEYENTGVPSRIKSDIILMASSFGGANWVVNGIDDNSFNNNVGISYKGNRVDLIGYNYDQLIGYAEHLMEKMSENKRVYGLEIWGSGNFDSPGSEYSLDYDFEALEVLGISPYEYYHVLRSPLYNSVIGTIPYEGSYVNVRMGASSNDEMDLWHVNNVAVGLREGKMKLDQIGSVTMKATALPIQKARQSYEISVRFNFLGSSQMVDKLVQSMIDYMNDEVLPVGYTAKTSRGNWFYENKDKYAGLILLVIACIFVICSVHFNSLRYPLAIIFLVPVSFIGVFLVFGLSDFPFDKGGFAAFVMLSGITVNAGIYLVSAFLKERTRTVRAYCKAFNKKIIPISLTIISSIIGLVPFLFDGPSEVFWFDFAIGTITGLVFSVIALVLYLPAFSLDKSSVRRP